MTTPILPYIPSMGINHTLVRQFIPNMMKDGYVIENTAESHYPHPDGNGTISTYPGQNRFAIGYKKTLYGATALANLLWDFFLTRLDNINEPFFFYNCPTERSTPDLTGVDTIGRYFVKLEDPNQVLNRELFMYCLYSYSFIFIENKNFNVIDYLAISPPWSYWKMDEVGTGNRVDQSGYTRTLVPTIGTITNAVGKISNCAYFQCNGANSPEFSFSSAPDISNNKPIFVSFWFKWDRINAGAATAPVFYTEYGLRINVVVATGSSVASITATMPNLSVSLNAVIAEDTWYLIQVYYDGMKLVAQINNSTATGYLSYLVGDSLALSTPSVLYIASFTPSNILDMYVDELGVWTDVDAIYMINQKKILYNSGSGLTYPIVLV
jgi:hypothetical protein